MASRRCLCGEWERDAGLVISDRRICRDVRESVAMQRPGSVVKVISDW